MTVTPVSDPRVRRSRLPLEQAAWSFGLAAAFPRMAWWPGRLGPRGVLGYAALNVFLRIAIQAWLLPYFGRVTEQREHAERVLRERLGREPSNDEVMAELGFGPAG